MPSARARKLLELGIGLLVMLAATTRATGQEEALCAAWPGEVDPLPTVADPDPFLRRWAELRAAELARLAQALEGESAGEAHALWVHAACLDPGAGRAERLEPVFRVAARPPSPAPTPGPPPAVAVAPPPPRPRERPAPAPEFTQVDRSIAVAQNHLREARFRAALEDIRQLRQELDSARGPGAAQRRASAEVLAATAFIALGLTEEASGSLSRALEADSELELDPRSTPPKLRRLFDQLRERGVEP